MSTTERPLADTGTPWHQGWYRFARHCPSPNHGPRPADTPVTLALLHSISLPPGEYGTGQVQALFCNTLDWDAHPYFGEIRGLEVSAHFLIERSGALWQFVGCDQRAWHAGVSCHRGRANCNDYSVGIELEGLEGEPFETAQYETLQSVLAALLAAYPISDIAGHEHVAPQRKHDPGAGFDWPRLQRSLGLPDRYFPQAVLRHGTR